LPHRRQLLIEGQPIRIGGRAFDVLLALIEARGAAVSKDALISRVWPNRNVEENALQAQISALRDIFGADRDLIRTVRGRGFLSAGNLRDPLAGPLEQPIAASISADAALGEPRDRGLAVGNRSRRWRPSPPHWYWQDIRICDDGDSGQKRRTPYRRFAKSEHMTPSSISSALVECTRHGFLIISLGSNRPFWIA
jgi:DNA-binding winged helix-turn-helix (wHTH) protein